jgi:hypothetical protein
MMSAPMCTKSLAAWKMMVLAASIVREKHFASIPGRSPELSYGPTNAHSGIGTVSHIVWKLPKDIAGSRVGARAGEERERRGRKRRVVEGERGSAERRAAVKE